MSVLLSFLRPEGARGPEGRCFFFPKFFLCADSAERKKLAWIFLSSVQSFQERNIYERKKRRGGAGELRSPLAALADAIQTPIVELCPF
jgi:hypothetical protein